MLAGIHQTLFLNQWGVPEIRIGLKRHGGRLGKGEFLCQLFSGDGPKDFSDQPLDFFSVF